MNPKVTGLKVLKNYVYADVELGYHKEAGRVTTTVRMRADDPDVAAAMLPLLELLGVQATTVVRTTDFYEQVDVRSRDRVKESIASETQRLQRNNSSALGEAIRDLTDIATRVDDPVTQPVHPWQVKNAADKALRALRGLTGRD